MEEVEEDVEGNISILPSVEELEEYLKENELCDPLDSGWDCDVFEAMDETILQEAIGMSLHHITGRDADYSLQQEVSRKWI